MTAVPASIVTGQRGRAIVQRSPNRDFPADDQWMDDPACEALRAEEAIAPALGSASVRMRLGEVLIPGASSWRRQEIPEWGGRYLRLLSVTQDARGRDIRTPIWWGTFQRRRLSLAPAATAPSGMVDFECVGLAAILDQDQIDSWVELSAGILTDTIEIADLPVFNGDQCGSAAPAGNRSAQPLLDLRSGQTVGPGVSAYVFSRSGSSDLAQSLWTAAQAIDYLLAMFNRRRRGSLRWRLAGARAELVWTGVWDCRRCTTWEGITRILSARRGLSVRVRQVYEEGQAWAELVVDSTAPVGVGSSTDPFYVFACTQQAPLDLRSQARSNDLHIEDDGASLYDEIVIRGRPIVLCTTLKITTSAPTAGDLVKGWTTAEETAWNADPDAEKLAHVWRRFAPNSTIGQLWPLTLKSMTSINPLVDSWGTDGSGSFDPEAMYGLEGLTGAIDTDGSGDRWPPAALRFDRVLPIFEGYEYATGLDPAVAPTADAAKKPRQPLLIDGEDTAAIEVGDEFGVGSEPNDAAVNLGSGRDDQVKVKGALPLRLTIALRAPIRIKVSWVRPPGECPRGPEMEADRRRIVIDDDRAELHLLAKDTWVLVDDARAVKKVATGGGSATVKWNLLRDDRARLRQRLVLAKAWYATPSWTISWTEHGTVAAGDNLATYPPGTLIPTVNLGEESLRTVNAVITRRAWDFQAWTTTRSCQRIAADLDTTP